MTGDPHGDDFDRQRDDAIRAEAVRQQRQALRDIESWARHQPPPGPGHPPADPVHLIRIGLTEPPAVLLALTRWPACVRLVSDAGDLGRAAEVTDLGPWPASPGDIPPNILRHLAIVPPGLPAPTGT